jgi:hypothetical protein
MINRAELEEACEFFRRRLNENKPHHHHAAVLVDAAEAHLATLPKTKMVEVWHLEYARLQSEGYWAALVEGGFTTAQSAKREAERMGHDSKNACLCVTGPHQQEVPA